MHLITHSDSWNMPESIRSRSYATRRTLPTFIKDLMLWSSVFWSADGPMYAMNMNETVGIMSISPLSWLYAKAHVQTLTKDNICWLLRPRVLFPSILMSSPATKMAPSLETSSQSGLPVYLSSPVRAVSAMLMDYRTHPPTAKSSQSSLPALSTHLSSPTWSAVDSLAQSSDHSSYHLVR